MASSCCGFLFKPSPLYYEELFNWRLMQVDVDQVSVNLSNKFDRKPLENELENQMEETWQKRLKELPSLYNGTKFRLRDVAFNNGHLELDIGMTCYRDYMCTNMRGDWRERIRGWGLEKYNDPHACFADPIGVNGLVVSSDEKIVFLRRSHQVYEAAGMIHLAGGHPEPSEFKNEKGEFLKLEDMDQKSVVHELFYSVMREVRDEVNIPLESMSWPVLIGILRNQETSGKPELCFLIRCSLTSQRIKECYGKGGPEAYESTEIVFVNTSELKEFKPSKQLTNIMDEMTANSKATLHIYIQQENSDTKTVLTGLERYS